MTEEGEQRELKRGKISEGKGRQRLGVQEVEGEGEEAKE